MTDPATHLTYRLHALQHAWDALGLRTDWYYHPGLTDSELGQQALDAPFEVTPEMRAWWSWHNGRDHQTDDPPGYEDGFGSNGWVQLSLAGAITDYLDLRDYALSYPQSEEERAQLDMTWRAGWVPIAQAGANRLVVDLNEPRGASHALRVVDSVYYDPVGIVVDSIADAVDVWIGTCRGPDFTWDPYEHQFQPTPGQSPSERHLFLQ